MAGLYVFDLVKEGDVAALKELVSKQGKDVVCQTDRYGQSTLHIAVEAGKLEVVRYLLVLGHPDPNVTDRNGWTPLMVRIPILLIDLFEFVLINDHILSLQPNPSFSPTSSPSQKTPKKIM